MDTVDNNSLDNPLSQSKPAHAHKRDAIVWALLLIWVGFAVLANVGWGWALLGIGGIVLGAQATLWQRAEAIDGFAVACGIVFLIGGAWIVFGLTWPLVPVLLILLGVALLWNAALDTQTHR